MNGELDPLPRERDWSRQVRSELKPLFRFAIKAEKWWRSFDRYKWTTTVTDSKLWCLTSLALTFQSTRQFRAAVRCLRSADASSALVLARAQYETLFATLFTMKPSIPLGLRELSEPAGKRYIPTIFDVTTPVIPHSLTKEKRSLLYVLHNSVHFFNGTRLGWELNGKSGPEPVRKIDRAEAELGDGWRYVLTHNSRRGYSGLRVKDLVRVLSEGDLDDWHELAYPYLSHIAHGSSAVTFFREVEGEYKLDWHSTKSEVEFGLIMSTSVFMASVDVYLDHTGSDPETRDAFNRLKDEFLRIRGR